MLRLTERGARVLVKAETEMDSLDGLEEPQDVHYLECATLAPDTASFRSTIALAHTDAVNYPSLELEERSCLSHTFPCLV